MRLQMIESKIALHVTSGHPIPALEEGLCLKQQPYISGPVMAGHVTID